MKKPAATILFVAACLSACLFALSGDTSGSEARKLVAEGALLVDVRSPEEYGTAHVDGAVNIPVGELESRLQELGDTHKTIVVYCRSGARSKRAKAILEKSGFESVYDLGAMSRW